MRAVRVGDDLRAELRDVIGADNRDIPAEEGPIDQHLMLYAGGVFGFRSTRPHRFADNAHRLICMLVDKAAEHLAQNSAGVAAHLDHVGHDHTLGQPAQPLGEHRQVRCWYRDQHRLFYLDGLRDKRQQAIQILPLRAVEEGGVTAPRVRHVSSTTPGRGPANRRIRVTLRAAVPDATRPAHHSSSRTVTGPSLISSTCMWAPNLPVSTSAPCRRSACANASISGSATAPGAAAFHDGRRPLAVSAYNVNWLITMIGALMSAADRSSSRILSCQSFSASRWALPISSSWVIPTNASSPWLLGRIDPTTC